ncbi:MAG: PQQ-binding-like beta-propeller repeat protein [Phycisphaeraceae bacterium]|nr:PQQ-binding-like beta-propeller repeat protein [Phycisphaeraceae bacterium]
MHLLKTRLTNTRLGIVLFLLLMAQTLQASDWPMYRADAARTGYTSDPLPARLKISWVRKADHAPQPAWSGRDTRMPFDLTFQPVASGGLVFFGNSVDGTVYALNGKTGREQWRFVTEGPVRFAPAIWQDRLFVVSDDGVLYCLAAGDGTLIWKKRGGPNPDMVWGNDHLISRWPARGGPVIKDGIVYFGAGIWPSEGIYLVAVEASTGRTVWVNDSSGDMMLEHPHGGNLARSGVSIQGYLAVAGQSLVVPTGRATPAVFDRGSGDFRYFRLQEYGFGWGARKGAGPFVSVIDEDLFLVEDDVFQTADGLFLERGLPVSSCAILPDMLVFTRGHEIRALKKSSLWIEEEDPNGVPVSKLSFDNLAWSITCPNPVGTTEIRATLSNETPEWPQATEVTNPPLVVGGSTIVMATLNNKVVTVDMTSRAIVTTVELDGLGLGLAIADQALYVSTDKGTIYCFVSAENETPVPLDASHTPTDPQPVSPYRDSEAYARAAREILNEADLRQGYCVDLGCGDGGLAYALARASQLHIIAIDEDPRQVALARQKLSEAGLYGDRVTVLQRDLANSGLPARFARLVVSGRSVTDVEHVTPAEEIGRLLNPYRGVALIGASGSFQRTVAQAPAHAGEWTHQYADAANTLCAGDGLAQGPLKMLWFKDFGVQMPSRHGRGPAPLCKNGIMIVEGMHGLMGVDAYSGRRLWYYALDTILGPYDQEHLVGTAGTGSNMCLAADSVFVRQGTRCLRISMKTGTLIREYAMPDNEGVWGYIACSGGVLYGTSADRTHVVRQLFRNLSTMKDLLSQSRSLFALDIETGKPLWVYKARASLRHNAIAIGHGRLYLVDKAKQVVDLPAPSADEDPESLPAQQPQVSALLCLDAVTGEILWEKSDDIYGTTLAVNSNHKVLLMSYQYAQRSFQLPSEKGDRLTGFRTTDGQRLWDTEARYISRPIINDSTIYAQPYAYDLLSGIRHASFKIEGRQPGGCGPMSGSTNLLLYRSGTLGYIDLLTNSATQNYGPVRPGCWINAIVAGGLVLMPDATDRCTCSYLIKASIALVPVHEMGF